MAAAGLGIAGEAAAVAPRAIGLDGDDLGGRGGEQLAVVADVEDRLAGRRQLALEPALAGHVEEVVRLVEQQDVVVAAEQDLEGHPLLLAAGERAQRPVGDGR